jgi:hypothetical protein
MPDEHRPPRNADELFDPEGSQPDPVDRILDQPPRTNDPRALKQRAISQKARDLTEENDLRAIVATPEGRRFIVRLLMRCGIDQPVYHPSNSTMCEIAGRRQIANDLRDWVKNCGLEQWFAVEQEFEQYRPKPKTSERDKKA